ncbi:DNA ligase [Stenotrophomonas phage A1432]|uniref:DNA ligase n=1 Tax=Stenotrophomonas phage A1432 TaxID=2930315 RepID=A0A9E7ST45_9CAUD|nr:DNA ligase [Stenotrophomonas phage A1432]UTC27955.1 DNA ligase [Stenotrophomonas phage A1432]
MDNQVYDTTVAQPLFRPMLAATVKDVNDLRFPLWASPKLDGLRGTGHAAAVFSRSMKLLPNRFLQEYYACGDFNGLDAEIMVGDPRDKEAFRAAMSGLTTRAGQPDFSIHVFDDFIHPGAGFSVRNDMAKARVALHQEQNSDSRLVYVPQFVITDLEDLGACERDCLEMGYEGVMLRHPGAPYKFGRGTMSMQDLLKLKQFEDGEAVIIGFEELMRNDNEAVTNELGLTSRSTAQSGKYGGGTLGALRVRAINGPFTGVEFSIGSGFTADQRLHIWLHRELFLGKIVTYKWFKIGSINAPRFPVYKGIRHPVDMG